MSISSSSHCEECITKALRSTFWSPVSGRRAHKIHNSPAANLSRRCPCSKSPAPLAQLQFHGISASRALILFLATPSCFFVEGVCQHFSRPNTKIFGQPLSVCRGMFSALGCGQHPPEQRENKRERTLCLLPSIPGSLPPGSGILGPYPPFGTMVSPSIRT